MSDDVLAKLDALLRKHAANEPEIPVLTDLVEPPHVDLNAIPVLTEEITIDPFAPPLELELDLIPEPIRIDPAHKQAETEAVLAQLNAMEAEVQAEVDARIAQVQTEPAPRAALAAPEKPPKLPPVARPGFSIEIPPDAQYIALPHTEMEMPLLIADTQILPPALPDEALRSIATMIEADVARILQDSLRQTLSEELRGMLHVSLDKVLSSMLDQHMLIIEETVRSTIADEFKKQIAPFKRQPPQA